MMKRAVVFASFSKTGKIENYVLTYLSELRRVADTVIFIADNALTPAELEKLSGLADFIQAERHGEYDFGSYRRGLKIARENGVFAAVDELILCNDSCFCVSSLSPVFNQMEMRPCDFWGLVQSDVFLKHLQSYFLVFKRNVFDRLEEFLNTVEHKNSLYEVVTSYETALTGYLESFGFKSAAYTVAAKNENPTKKPLRMMWENAFPLVKKKCFIEPSACDEDIRKVLDALSASVRGDICGALNCGSTREIQRRLLCRRIKEFLFKKKTTLKGKTLIKICKIPVWSKKRS